MENLSFGPNEARFELEGRAIQLRDAGNSPSVAAFRAFYDSAVADYRARAERPGWWSRLRSWVGRMFGAGAPEAAVPHDGHPHAHSAPHESPRRPVSTRPQEPAEASPLVPARGHKEPSQKREGGRERERAQASPGAPPPGAPSLTAVFADEKGVHVIWRAPARSQCKSLEFTYALDSGLARRLQDCYGQLSQLGYKVIGLEILTAPRAPEADKPAVARPPSPEPQRTPEPQSAQPAAEKPKAAAARKRVHEAEREKREVDPKPGPVTAIAVPAPAPEL